MAKKTKRRARKPRRRKRPGGRPVVEVQAWPTDPMGGVPPLRLPAPDLAGTPLGTRIVAPAPAPPAGVHGIGTAEFRYWTAGEALRRSAALWSAAGVRAWHPRIGAGLAVRLDDGVDLNAYYARDDYAPQNIKQGLSFFHDSVRDATSGQHVTVYSGESPDVVGHELGHAVLDSLKPGLWDVATTEAAAFHESFGDMTAVLAALQLPAVRQTVLEETDGRLWRNSSVSRVAEQLGWAIRQRSPRAVDPDSLRNAANSFVYADPTTLPPSGPASTLTRAPHNFSRVFTGAFLEALGGMVPAGLSAEPDAGDVLRASRDMAWLLAEAVVQAPIRTRFFHAVAEQLVLADSRLTGGRYAQALTTALVRRGLLPLRSLASAPVAETATLPAAAAAAARFAAVSAGGADASGALAAGAARPVRMVMDGGPLGLPVTTLFVEAPAVEDGTPVPPALGIAAEAVLAGRYAAVHAFVEDLVQRGRVGVESRVAAGVVSLAQALSRRRVTHQVVRVRGGVELRRVTFECGR